MNSTGELLSQVIKGDRKSIAKAITLVESKKPQDRALADDLLGSLSQNQVKIAQNWNIWSTRRWKINLY